MGERTVETYGSCVFEDLTNNRKAVIITNTYKKTGWIRSTTTGNKDQLEGIIYHTRNKLTGDKKSIQKNYARDMDMISDLKNLKDNKETICGIEGSFLNNLVIDG